MTAQIIAGMVFFVLAALMVLLAVRHFKCKGYCFSNAYIWASKEQRESEDFTPYYKQSGVVFLMLAALSVIEGLYIILMLSPLIFVQIVIVTAMFCYAVTSTIRISKEVMENKDAGQSSPDNQTISEAHPEKTGKN